MPHAHGRITIELAVGVARARDRDVDTVHRLELGQNARREVGGVHVAQLLGAFGGAVIGARAAYRWPQLAHLGKELILIVVLAASTTLLVHPVAIPS